MPVPAPPPPRPASDGSLWDPIFGASRVGAQVDERAWLRAMLDVEAALARAGARVGLVEPAAADAVAAACDPDRYDPGALGRAGAAGGNPVIPLVRALTAEVAARAGPAAAEAVHLGATSQDVMDSAAMLLARRALGVVLDDLRGAADAAAGHARRHRDTLLAGRTLLQQALPTTFGLKAAGWAAALDAAGRELGRVRRDGLAVQFAGAAGTLASLHPHGLAVRAALAAELGLVDPVLPWHTDRTRIAALAGALGVAAGAVAKAAGDVVLLAQTEVAEVHEAPEAAGAGGAARRGGSSAMPHKANPVAAVTARAAAMRAPGLVATLLASAGAAEHERAAGAWHAEWQPLSDLLRCAGGAAARLRESLSGLSVDAARMRANLEASGGLLLTERIAAALAPATGRLAAHDAVAGAARSAREGASTLRDALLAQPLVAEHLDGAALDALLDPAGYLGHAGELVDRSLAARTFEDDRPPGGPDRLEEVP